MQVAANCWVPVPATIEAVAGESVMLLRAGLVTVSAPVPETEPDVALMVVVPEATPVARPFEAMVAAAALLLDQVTVEEQFEVVLFEYVQVAVYCCVPVPAAIDAVAGETAMAVTVGLVTVSVADPVVLPDVAEMVAVPAATPVARPVLLMVAAAVLPLDQVTVEEQFEVVLFEYEQVAAYCCVPLSAAMDAVAGVTAMLDSVGAVTVSEPVAERLPEVALMVEAPTATPVAMPALLTVAAAVLLLDQVTVEVQFELVLLE